MSALESLRQGDVQAALKELFDEVRNQPDQPKHRIFLFQLLSVAGQWDRALTQLNVARDLDQAAGVMAQAYQEILQCEALRSEVFAGKRTPLVFGEPEAWLAQLIDAVRLAAEGQDDEAAELRGQAFEAAPATSGTLTPRAKGPDGESQAGEPAAFEWIADGDSRLGPVLEIVMNGRYYWAPFHRIATISIERTPRICAIWCGRRPIFAGPMEARRLASSRLVTWDPSRMKTTP